MTNSPDDSARRRGLRTTMASAQSAPGAQSHLSMTSDRPCISDRGMMVNVGTKVTYLGHLPGQAVKVRMEDGSEEVVHPHCFPELR